jgi:hypothetical protein
MVNTLSLVAIVSHTALSSRRDRFCTPQPNECPNQISSVVLSGSRQPNGAAASSMLDLGLTHCHHHFLGLDSLRRKTMRL